jgi:hypothetical protein
MGNPPPRRWFQFSLGAMFSAVAVFAVWLGLLVPFPQVIVFASSVVLCGGCTWHIVRCRNRLQAPWRFLRLATVATWIALYFTSLGPAAFVSRATNMGEVIVVIYAPIRVLDSNRSMRRMWPRRIYKNYILWWENIGHTP